MCPTTSIRSVLGRESISSSSRSEITDIDPSTITGITTPAIAMNEDPHRGSARSSSAIGRRRRAIATSVIARTTAKTTTEMASIAHHSRSTVCALGPRGRSIDGEAPEHAGRRTRSATVEPTRTTDHGRGGRALTDRAMRSSTRVPHTSCERYPARIDSTERHVLDTATGRQAECHGD
jgi:hypothetical protein